MSIKVVRVMSAEDELKMQVQKLELNDGDILLVNVKQHMSDAMYENLSGSFKEIIGDRNVRAMLCEEGIDVTKLSEEDMRELGWVRTRPASVKKDKTLNKQNGTVETR